MRIFFCSVFSWFCYNSLILLNSTFSSQLSFSYSSLPTQFGADHGGQPEAPDVKLGLKAMITTKYKENGTDIPRVELKEREPPKPVSAGEIYSVNCCQNWNWGKTPRESVKLVNTSVVIYLLSFFLLKCCRVIGHLSFHVFKRLFSFVTTFLLTHLWYYIDLRILSILLLLVQLNIRCLNFNRSLSLSLSLLKYVNF